MAEPLCPSVSPVRESLPTRLLFLLAEATPEELVAVERLLKGKLLPKALAPVHEPGPAAPVEIPDPLGHTLRREPACWVLVLRGQRAFLKREIGLAYVAHLLSRPGEHVPAATLFSEFSTRGPREVRDAQLPAPETGDGLAMAELAPDRDEAEARSRYYAQLREYKDAFNDRSIPELEREEARRRYDELLGFLKQHYRPRREAGSEVIRSVHRAIQRLCNGLRTPAAGQHVPEPAKLAFAEYIERHILVPSRRYTRAKPGSNVRIARGELAGRLAFECPSGHHWSVQM